MRQNPLALAYAHVARLLERERKPLSVAFFVQTPLICVAFTVWFVAVRRGWVMQDFMAVRSGAKDVLRGVSPYPAANAAAVAKASSLVYPPFTAYVFVPFALLPYAVGACAYVVLLLAAVPAALWLIGVRDWRCYGVVFMWAPLLACLRVGALGPVLVLLAAAAWRYRDRAVLAGFLLAAVISLKLFLWPLAFWPLAMRRWRASAATFAFTAAALFVPFVPLGTHVLRAYPHLLQVLDGVFGPVSFSSVALFEAMGASPHAAAAGLVCLALVLMGLLVVLARGADGDRRAFVLGVGASLLLSPIVWTHYYVLLALPLALTRPRLTRAWLIPLVLWSAPALESHGNLRLLLTGIAIVVSVVAVCIRPIGARRSALVPAAASGTS
jgi:alpha-1,2-mannosyltransferase